MSLDIMGCCLRDKSEESTYALVIFGVVAEIVFYFLKNLFAYIF
jgi:hypothetical protein